MELENQSVDELPFDRLYRIAHIVPPWQRSSERSIYRTVHLRARVPRRECPQHGWALTLARALEKAQAGGAIAHGHLLCTPMVPLAVFDGDGVAALFTSISTTGLPAGLSIDTATGLIAGTLPFGSAGTYAVTARVSDGSQIDSKTLT